MTARVVTPSAARKSAGACSAPFGERPVHPLPIPLPPLIAARLTTRKLIDRAAIHGLKLIKPRERNDVGELDFCGPGGRDRGIVGFVASLAAEGVQRRIHGPKLALDYGSGDAYRAPSGLSEAGQKVGDIYIRLRVRNLKPRVAKACRAYLTRIEKKRPDDNYEDTLFKESVQLAWSAQGPDARFDPLDIPMGIDQFIDIVRTDRLLEPQMQPMLAASLSRYAHLWSYRGSYRMTVLGRGREAGKPPDNCDVERHLGPDRCVGWRSR